MRKLAHKIKSFKLTKLHIDKDIYKQAQNTIQRLVPVKKRLYLEKKP